MPPRPVSLCRRQAATNPIRVRPPEVLHQPGLRQGDVLDSDTDMVLLTPTSYEDMPLTQDEAESTREMVEALDGSRRLLVHGRVIPNLPGDLERMAELAKQWKVAAWKTYTQASPDGSTGWWLDDEEFGAPLIGMARKTGVRTICIHRAAAADALHDEGQPPVRRLRRRRARGPAEPGHHLHRLSLRPRSSAQERAGRARQARSRHRLADPVADRQRREAEQQRLRRAGNDLALPDARADGGRARARQAVPLRRREQRRVGNGLHLVRLAAGRSRPRSFRSRRSCRRIRLPGDYLGASWQVSAQRPEPHGPASTIRRTFTPCRGRNRNANGPTPTFLTYGRRHGGNS